MLYIFLLIEVIFLTEKDLQKQIKEYAIEQGAYIKNIHGGSIYQAAGIPDLLACYKGYFVGIEVKVGYNKPSEIQKVNLKQINLAGGYDVLAYDLETVKKVFKDIDRRRKKDGTRKGKNL